MLTLICITLIIRCLGTDLFKQPYQISALSLVSLTKKAHTLVMSAARRLHTTFGYLFTSCLPSTRYFFGLSASGLLPGPLQKLLHEPLTCSRFSPHFAIRLLTRFQNCAAFLTYFLTLGPVGFLNPYPSRFV